ncbi:hypothetical protein [uncultured Amnibacterium sp.]|uniref:hypothetical protein n=1 Tax=uncultured Amnibacterium sp. TaxID=1631851 RepID=UPI0035C9BD80
MPVEFQLGSGDHRKVEEFLSRDPAGVAAITLHTKRASYQDGAAEAARELGIDVLWDPRTELLFHPDPSRRLQGLPGATTEPLDVDALARSYEARLDLVDAVLAAQPDLVTAVTPPTVLVEDERSARLAVDLAYATRVLSDLEVRPRVLLGSQASEGHVELVATGLADHDINWIELSLSPLRPETDGLRKFRRALARADVFTGKGIRVTLGNAGNLGPTAIALGHVASYSVGISQGEQFDHRAAVSRQKNPPKPKFDDDGKPRKGAWHGAYLPPLAATVAKSSAEELLQHSDIRTRLGCRIDNCADSIRGLLDDTCTHYLHARADEIAQVDATPARWRPEAEARRLRRAQELRGLLNARYLPAGHVKLPLTGLSNLLDLISLENAAIAA